MPVILPENRHSIQLNHALNFAHVNCHDSLQLDSLAKTACLSKYHFLRIFHDQIGESPVTFLKRIRLERAACMLTLNRKLPILEVGLNCGFSSAQLFARSFANRFERSPREFRNTQLTLRYAEGSKDIDLLHQRFRSIALGRDKQLSTEKVKIITRPPVKVAYVRNIGRYGPCDGISRAMESVVAWAKTKDLWTQDTNLIGVSWDYSSITPSTMCRYDACINIPDHYRDTKGISVQTLKGGTFAVMRASVLRAEDIIPAWQWFYFTLRTSPEFQPYRVEDDVGPWYEVFHRNKQATGILVDMHVHLQRRSNRLYSTE